MTLLAPVDPATAQYSAGVTWTDGRATREVLAATTGSRIPQGAAVLDGEADGEPVQVGVWRWPLDPPRRGPAARPCTRTGPSAAVGGAGETGMRTLSSDPRTAGV